MAYSSSRMVSTKVDSTPSLLCNNLSAGPGKLVYAHKDTICSINSSAIDGRASVDVNRLIDYSGLTQIALVVLCGQTFIAATWRSCFVLYRPEESGSIESPAPITSSPGGGPAQAQAKDTAPQLKAVCAGRFTLSDLGVPEPRQNSEFFRGLAAPPGGDTLFVGTSWGDVQQVTVTVAAGGEGGNGARYSSQLGTRLSGGHKAAVTCVAADEKFIVSCDDNGSVCQWDASNGKLLVRHDRGAGAPATCVALRGDIIVVGFASGHLRVFRCGISPGSTRFMEVEVTAHSRACTALDAHPSLPTFASVGEDGLVNVWSFPELGVGALGLSGTGTGRARIVLDTAVRVPNAVLTGVAFVCPGWSGVGKVTGPVHIVAAAYDTYALSVFLGLR